MSVFSDCVRGIEICRFQCGNTDALPSAIANGVVYNAKFLSNRKSETVHLIL